MTPATTLAMNVVTSVTNPLEGVTPSIEVFGIDFSGRLTVILAGIWALVLFLSAVAVLLGGAKWAYAARVTHSADGVMEGAGQFKTALIAFGVIAAASLLLGAVIWLVQG